METVTPEGHKQCTACRASKPLSEFHKHKGQRDGRNPKCRDCKNAFSAGYYSRWTDEQRDKHKRRVAASRYGLTASEYECLMEIGACEICGIDKSARGRLCIDHDHNTGAVRGVLCQNCNLAIGYLGDDHKLVSRAVAYLTKE